jgi:branched-chain amino acid transport system ATP-binding protein
MTNGGALSGGMLIVEDIHTYYGESYILQGVSLRVERGQVVGILGRNGMGKTTLIRSIIGFTPPRAGRVVFKNQDITSWPSYRSVALGMGVVPQGRRIFASLTVVENLAVAARGTDGRWTRDSVMDLFPRLRERAESRAGQLSGGEQQMLAIARALMTNPDLLLMDEPTEGLAPLLVRAVGQAIAQLRAGGLSIVLVEQNLSFALHLADEVHVLSKGKIVFSGTPADLKASHDVRSRHLGV